jgi:hypothetical protein
VHEGAGPLARRFESERQRLADDQLAIDIPGHPTQSGFEPFDSPFRRRIIEHLGECQMGASMVRVDGEGALIGDGGVCQLTAIQARRAKVVLELCVPWHQACGLLEIAGGGGIPPSANQDIPEGIETQGIGVRQQGRTIHAGECLGLTTQQVAAAGHLRPVLGALGIKRRCLLETGKGIGGKAALQRDNRGNEKGIGMPRLDFEQPPAETPGIRERTGL